jgi:hypothetical protein
LREAFGFVVCLCRTLGPRYLPLHLRDLALCLAEKAGVLHLLPFAIGVVRVQPYVNASHDPGVLMRLHTADGDTELTEIAVCSPDDPHAFDGGQGIGSRGAERLVCLLVTRLDARAYEPYRSDAYVVTEGDVLAIRGQTPARCFFVFHAPAIMLKLGRAFLAGNMLLTIVIEPAHRRPGSSSARLPSLGT